MSQDITDGGWLPPLPPREPLPPRRRLRIALAVGDCLDVLEGQAPEAGEPPGFARAEQVGCAKPEAAYRVAVMLDGADRTGAHRLALQPEDAGHPRTHPVVDLTSSHVSWDRAVDHGAATGPSATTISVAAGNSEAIRIRRLSA